MTLCVLGSMVRIERDCQFVIQTLSSVLFVKRPCGLLCSAVMISLICQVAESITTVAPGHFFSGGSAHCSTAHTSPTPPTLGVGPAMPSSGGETRNRCWTFSDGG